MISLLSSNLQALKQYAPEQLALFDEMDVNIQEEYGYRFTACDARDGSQIDMLSNNGTQIYLQSRYRPLEEAAHFVGQYQGAKTSSCFIFLGLGNGYIIRELMQRTDVTYVFYEPSLSYYIYLLQNYDFSDIFAAPNVHIYVKGLNEKKILLESYLYVNEWNWHNVFLDAIPKYKSIYPDAWQWLTRLWEDSVWHAQNNYMNGIVRAEHNLENAIYNFQYIYQGDSIFRFKDILPEEVPVIVIAGGPSLEKNVGQIMEYRDRAFIIAVDRVAGFLSKHGVVPHAYVTVDANKPEQLFVGDGIDKIPWFLFTTAHYRAVQKIANARLIFCSTLYDYARDLFQLAETDLSNIANGGSVATLGVTIGMYLGSRKIILVGQDLALSEGKPHAGEEAVRLPDENAGLIEVPGFYGQAVYTDKSLKTYLDWYQAFTPHHPEINFVNATEGGAFIDGMQHMAFREAMRPYEELHIDGDAYINSIPPLMDEEKQRKLRNEYNSFFIYMKKVKQAVPSAIADIEKGLHMLAQYGYTYPELDKVESSMEKFQSLYNGHKGKTLLDLGIARQIQEALLDLQYAQENPTEELKRLYNKMLAYFKGIQDTVDKAIPMMEEVLQIIGE